MDYESLTRPQREAYARAVSGTHHRRVELVVLTLDGDPVQSLTNMFLGGSIHGDVTRTPVEVLEARVLDVDAALDWTNGQHRRFKIQVIDHRFVGDLNEWVEAAIFTGPIWDFFRQGAEVTLVAQGSERLAMGSLRTVFKKPRKTKATVVIRDMLRDAGALPRNLRIPDLNARLPERVTVGVKRGKKSDEKGKRQVLKGSKRDTYWPKAEAIAEAIDRELFADGSGNFVLRPPVTKPTVRFTNSLLLAPPVERRADEGERTNTWIVKGADPKGPRKQIQAEVSLPKRHPLSRQRLSWNGKAREVSELIENENLESVKQARLLGQRKRDKAMRELMDYEFEAIPMVPWLRPNGLVTIPLAGGGRARVRVRQWTLPLGPTPDPLVIGANRRSGWK